MIAWHTEIEVSDVPWENSKQTGRLVARLKCIVQVRGLPLSVTLPLPLPLPLLSQLVTSLPYLSSMFDIMF